MTNVGICGANGKMGKRLLALLETNVFPPLHLTQTFTASNHFHESAMKTIDVLIDFSTPAAFASYSPWVREFRKPLVIGTTGYSLEEKKEINALSQYIPLLMSPNMSIGMNILFELVKKVDPMILGNFSNLWKRVDAYFWR